MKAKTIHCEECVEEIPSTEAYWEDARLYCGRCGSEFDISKETGDLLDAISKRRTATWQTANDDVEDDDIEDDEDLDEDEDDEDEESELEEDEEEPEEDGNGRRS